MDVYMDRSNRTWIIDINAYYNNHEECNSIDSNPLECLLFTWKELCVLDKYRSDSEGQYIPVFRSVQSNKHVLVDPSGIYML